MGIPKPKRIAILVERAGRAHDLGERLDAIHRDFVARSIEFYRRDPSVHEVAGATVVFRRLREFGIRVALDTGFDRAITQVILDRLGWALRGVIDASITSDEVPRGRPHPDMIVRLMDDLSGSRTQRAWRRSVIRRPTSKKAITPAAGWSSA